MLSQITFLIICLALEEEISITVAFGENSAIAHAKPSDRKLKVGDVILIDFGATFNGYHSDMTRTFVFGSCSEEIENLYNIVLGAIFYSYTAKTFDIYPGFYCNHHSVLQSIICSYS